MSTATKTTPLTPDEKRELIRLWGKVHGAGPGAMILDRNTLDIYRSKVRKVRFHNAKVRVIQMAVGLVDGDRADASLTAAVVELRAAQRGGWNA